jgi:hypothetical protein
MGFSAGGHEASTLGGHYDEPFGYQPIDAIDQRLVLVEGGMHGPAILNGKPAIRKTKDPYADSMVQWINDLFDHR